MASVSEPRTPLALAVGVCQGLDRKIICSCGYSFPVNEEVIKGKFYGMDFFEFLGQINWAYGLASNSINVKVDKKIERKIKFPNPIMEIEL